MHEIRAQITNSAFDREQRAQWQVLAHALETAEAEIASVDAELQRSHPVAPFDGTVRDIDPELSPGVWLGGQELVARVVGNGELQVIAYVGEDSVGLLGTGAAARFYTAGGVSTVRL